MSQRRVVITGMGAVTPLGLDVPTTWANLIAGKSGVSPITSWDASQVRLPLRGAGARTSSRRKYFFNEKDARRADRYAQLAMASAKEAVKHGGLDPQAAPARPRRRAHRLRHRRARIARQTGRALITKGPNRVSPFMIPMMISNMAAGLISMEFGFAGPNFCVVTACATSNNCIGEAWRLIRDDEADIILAGGSEAACVPLGMSGFAAMKALSTRNDEPERASRPFDKDRDGFVMGEGAGTVILEELEHAKKRGANILAELTGYGLTADAYHMTSPAPGGAGAVKAMQHCAQARGSAAGQGRLHQRARHLDAGGRRGRDRGDQGRLRRTCEEARGQLDQVDDRPPARRGRRGGTDFLHQGHRAQHPAAHDQSR